MENESSWRGPDSCRRARRRASPGLTNRAHQSDEPEFRMMPYRDLEAVACGLEVAYRAVRLMVEGGKTQLVKHDSEWDEPPPRERRTSSTVSCCRSLQGALSKRTRC